MDNICQCLECKRMFYQERDLEICDNCIIKFDVNRLWNDYDNNKIDVLDFNERESIRERYRIK